MSQPGARKPVLFYGVNSEGMGHATRSRVVIEMLSRHYTVHVFCGGRARAFLRRYFPRVHRVWWGSITYRDNRADVRTTVIRSFLQGPWVLLTGGWVTLLSLLLRPVAILTDFECLTAWAGMLTFRKVITLDNQQLMLHGTLPPPREKDIGPLAVVRRVMFFNTPVVHRALVSSFWRPPLKPGVDAARVRYVPVAVRDAVMARVPTVSTDGPVLVYQTSGTNRDLPGTLEEAARKTGLRFAVYGMGTRDAAAGGAVTFHAFDEDGFLSHLAAAPFVIMNGGHSTLCEAMVLGKPVLAEPVADQYEQSVNGFGLQALGIGRWTDKLLAGDIVAFAGELEPMRARMREMRVADNQALLRDVMTAIAEVNPRRAVAPAAADAAAAG